MQIHPRVRDTKIGVPCINQPDTPTSFGVLPLGGVELYVFSEAEADELIKAACLLKDRLHEYDTAEVWAVRDSAEGEVAGPMNRVRARQYIEDNAQSFIGALSIVPATPDAAEPVTAADDAGRAIAADLDQRHGTFVVEVGDLDAQLQPPGYSLPAIELPSTSPRCDSRWSNGAGTGQCVGTGGHQGQHADATGHRWTHAPAGAR